MNDKSSNRCPGCDSEMVPVMKRRITVGGILSAFLFVLGIPAVFYNPVFGMVPMFFGLLISIVAGPGNIMECMA